MDQVLSGPPCCSTRPRAMDRGPRSTITTGPGPVRASLTAIARSAIVDVLAQHPAGAGTFDRWARSTGGPRIGPGENAYLGKPLADPGTSPTRGTSTYELPGSNPNGTSPAQVGRVYPKPPRCSPFGDANGVRLP